MKKILITIGVLMTMSFNTPEKITNWELFITPKPYPSWIINEDTNHWKPPVAYPNDGKTYTWNEETTSWE